MNVIPNQIIDFLQASGPFDELEHEDLHEIARRSQIVYLTSENQQEILEQHANCLYLIQSGQFSVKDSDGELQHLSEGDYFNYAALLDKVVYTLVVTVESAGLILCLPARGFELALTNPKVAQFFAAAKENVLQHEAVNDSNSMWLHKPLSEVAEIKPITISQTDSIQSAGALMSQKRISSVLIIENKQLLGIVTDRDLRNRVVAQGLNMQLPVKQIMTENPAFLTSNRTLFDAVCLMNERTINHLPVLDFKTREPVGMITATDIFKQQRNNVLFVISDISKAQNLYELTRCAWQLPHYFASSAKRLGDFDIVGKVLSQATDVMTRRLITFFQQQHGEAPMPYCWLVYGSQAREDQTMGSDQDNALLLAYKPNEEQAEYFEKLASYVCLGLGKCGIKLCDGNIMASNPELRKSVDEAIDEAKEWIRQPTPEAILNFNIFLDARAAAGDKSLFEQLQKARQSMFKQSMFLAALAREANQVSVPLSIFHKFVYVKGRKEKDSIDIKTTAVAIVNSLVRIHSLANGVNVPSTVARLRNLPDDCGISKGDRKNLADIWMFLNRLRWRHQLNNKVQDNFVRISDLSSLEKHQLKAAFKTIHQAQQAAVLKYSGGIG